MVGEIILWFLLGVLALFILFLVLPTTLHVSYYKQELVVKVRVLFVVLRVFPFKQLTPEEEQKEEEKKQRKKQKQKAKEEKKKEKAVKKNNEGQKAEEEEQQNSKKKKSLEERILLIQQLVGSASKAALFIFKRIHVRDVEFVMPVHGEDAAKTAINYGTAQGVVGGVYATLQNLMDIRYKKIEIIPDFMDQYKEETTFTCKIDASPIIIVLAAIIGVFRYQDYRKEQKETYRAAAKEVVLARRKAAAQRRKQFPPLSEEKQEK